MKKVLLLPALCWSSIAFAQVKPVDCVAVKAENNALKEKIVAYEARLGIGVGGVTIIDGNDKLKVSYLSCKASKTTHKAVFTFMVKNTDEPITLAIVSNQNWTGSGIKSSFFDEQGNQCVIGNTFVGKVQVGYGSGYTPVPSNVPVQCSIELNQIPLTATNFNSVLIAFEKQIPGMDKAIPFVSGFKNVPITWQP